MVKRYEGLDKMGLRKIVQKTPKFHVRIENSIPNFQTRFVVSSNIKPIIMSFVKLIREVDLERWVKRLKI